MAKSSFSDNFEKVGGAWKKISKSGNKMLSMTIGNDSFMLFPNNYKSKQGDPDFIVYKSLQGSGRNKTNVQKPKQSVPAPSNNTDDDLEW